MKLSRIFAIAAAASFITFAGANAAGNIAMVNVQEIMNKSTAAQSIAKQIEAKRSSYQEQVKKQEESLRKADQDLTKQRSSLSAEALEQKRKEFRKKVSDVQQDVQKKRAQLDKAYAGAINEIQQKVTSIVADLSKDKGFDVAIPTSQLVYGKPEMDITAQVLEKLNKDMPDVKVSMESAN